MAAINPESWVHALPPLNLSSASSVRQIQPSWVGKISLLRLGHKRHNGFYHLGYLILEANNCNAIIKKICTTYVEISLVRPEPTGHANEWSLHQILQPQPGLERTITPLYFVGQTNPVRPQLPLPTETEMINVFSLNHILWGSYIMIVNQAGEMAQR